MHITTCIRFKPKSGFESKVPEIEAERKFGRPPRKGFISSQIINTAEGEYTMIAEYENLDNFMEMVDSQQETFVDAARKYCEKFENGEEFASFSGPAIDLEACYNES